MEIDFDRLLLCCSTVRLFDYELGVDRCGCSAGMTLPISESTITHFVIRPKPINSQSPVQIVGVYILTQVARLKSFNTYIVPERSKIYCRSGRK